MTQARRALLTLSLLALLAVGAGGVALHLHQQEQDRQAAQEKSARLFDFDPAQVTGLTVTAKGEQTTLVRQGSDWVLTRPVEAPADPEAVAAVLQRVQALRSKGEVEPAATELARYGLAPPAVRLELDLGGKAVGVSLGAENTFSGTQYAQLLGQPAVIQVEGSHDAVLSRGSFDLRDKHLVRVDPARVQRLTVDARSRHLVLERRAGGWQLLEPTAMAADGDAVAQLLGVLTGVRAEAIASETGADPARYGLDSPVARLGATLEDGRTLELSFGEASPDGSPQLFARATPGKAIARVPRGASLPLDVDLAALEDKTLARVERAEVAALELGQGQRAIVLKRERALDGGASERWVELAPHGGRVRPEKIDALLALLGNLSATARVPDAGSDLKSLGLSPPENRIAAQDRAGQTLAEVKLGTAHAGQVYAQRAGDARVFTLPQARLAALPTDPDALLEPLDGGP